MTTPTRTERGAAVVEAAIVSLVFFFLVFSIIEAAFFARAYLAARDAASTGARNGAIGADNPAADYYILQAINKSLSATSRGDVEAISIYNPQGAGKSLPSGCDTQGVSGVCNFYTAADLNRSLHDFQDPAAFSADQNWPASTRSTSIETGLGHVGVYIKLRVGGLTGPLPTVVSSKSVAEIEPHS